MEVENGDPDGPWSSKMSTYMSCFSLQMGDSFHFHGVYIYVYIYIYASPPLQGLPFKIKIAFRGKFA